MIQHYTDTSIIQNIQFKYILLFKFNLNIYFLNLNLVYNFYIHPVYIKCF